MRPSNVVNAKAFQFKFFCGATLVRPNQPRVWSWSLAEVGDLGSLVGRQNLRSLGLHHLLNVFGPIGQGREVASEGEARIHGNSQHIAPETQQFGVFEQFLDTRVHGCILHCCSFVG